MDCIIYGLVDPRNGQLRYVGKSQRGLRRPQEHLFPHSLQKDQTHKGHWIRQLRAEGLRYGIVVIQDLPDPEILPNAERFWISYFQQMGCPLTNLTAGGEGFTGEHSKETRIKMSEVHRQRWAALSPEERRDLGARISAAKKGMAVPEERRLRIARTLTGRHHSKETRERIAAAHRGVIFSEERRARISEAKKGKPPSPATRLAVVAANRRRKGMKYKKV